MRTCSLSGCDRKHYARDLCERHYRRVWERGGDPSVNRNETPTTVVRTWVYKHGRLIEQSERPANIRSENVQWRNL